MAAFLSPLRLEALQGDQWRVLEPLVYRSDLPGVGTLTVPVGVLTDLESVPRWLPITHAVLRDSARGAGVVHDYLYAGQLLPRRLADAVLYEAAVASQAAPWRAWALWLGVRAGGWVAYARYAAEHRAGSGDG